MKETVLLLMYFLILSSCSSTIVSLDDLKFNEDASLIIEQMRVQPDYIFLVENNNLIVKEIQFQGMKKGKVKIINRFSKKIGAEDLKQMHKRINNLIPLKDYYSKPIIGGIAWKVTINLEGNLKSIYVDNIKVLELVSLFQLVNKIIPEGFPKISIEPF